jgi:hypothetical protein
VPHRNYYFDELKNNHDYRALPVLLTLDKMVQLLGSEDRLGDIMNAMTFEVVVNTSFKAIWTASDHTYANGDVKQNADVKDIINALQPPDFLWGTTTGENMTLTSTEGTYYTYNQNGSIKTTVPLAGQTYTGSLWLLNWDACVTKTFDVMLSGFYIGDNESAIIAGPASAVALKDYWWQVAGAFIFTVPTENKAVNFGSKSFSGKGFTDVVFSGTAQTDIWIIHTPK